jgi:hypothetical protein
MGLLIFSLFVTWEKEPQNRHIDSFSSGVMIDAGMVFLLVVFLGQLPIDIFWSLILPR